MYPLKDTLNINIDRGYGYINEKLKHLLVSCTIQSFNKKDH